MRYLTLLLAVACVHAPVELPKLDDRILHAHINQPEQAEPTPEPYVGGYSGGGLISPVRGSVAKTILGSGAISLLGPGSSSASPTFTKVTLQTLQIPVGGGLAGNGCLGYSSSDNICFNPNQMDVVATAGINLNVSSGGAVNFAGSTSVDSSGNLAVRSNLLQVNGTQVLVRSNSLTQFSVGTAGTPWLDVQSTGVAVSIPITVSGANDITSGRSIITSTANAAVVSSGAGGYFQLGRMFVQNTAPTISSGFGSSPSIVSSNGTASFEVNVGTGGVATSGVIGLPAAVTGWNCVCQDITTPGANLTRQTASSTTTCTVTNAAMSTGSAAAWTASDKLRCNAMAY